MHVIVHLKYFPLFLPLYSKLINSMHFLIALKYDKSIELQHKLRSKLVTKLVSCIGALGDQNHNIVVCNTMHKNHIIVCIGSLIEHHKLHLNRKMTCHIMSTWILFYP